jgi:cellulose biosynthesis protein BcsQ
VLAVSSNKGGVGKTTVTSNLAIYLRALREELPILLVGLDDQRTLDRMFSLHPQRASEKTLEHAFGERSLASVIELGEYGIHYVPSPLDGAELKARATSPGVLREMLAHSEWRGLVLVDTKSDFEALTRNAYHAADRILVPVADWASLEEAGKLFERLAADGLPRERARILLTLVDRRARGNDGEAPLFETLAAEIARRDWPRFDTAISRSPRVEALNSGTATPLSILHHARGTSVHAEFRALADEVLADLGFAAESTAGPPRARDARREEPRAVRPRARREAESVGLRSALAPFSWASDLFDVLRGR